MALFTSDEKRLLNVEYDDTPNVNDIVDGMRVLSKNERDEEYCIFLLEKNGTICCYVLDEIYILTKVYGFDNLLEAVEAWKKNEI